MKKLTKEERYLLNLLSGEFQKLTVSEEKNMEKTHPTKEKNVGNEHSKETKIQPQEVDLEKMMEMAEHHAVRPLVYDTLVSKKMLTAAQE